MKNRPIIVQAVALLTACALLAGSFAMQQHLRDRAQAETIIDEQVIKAHPEVSLLNLVPGGLRSLLVSYYWIRCQDMMQNGRVFEAKQLSETICALQPHFIGAWDYLSWNMAWNISVKTSTPRERYNWVYNGIKLLRDKGIPLNPKALLLYKQVSWTFYNKMGGSLDEMHMVYKSRWASEMQHLLGAPPAGTTDDVIAAFAPIAAAPLDKNIAGDPEKLFQTDAQETLMKDPDVAKYSQLLEARGVKSWGSLLKAYNEFSNDEAAALVRSVGEPLEKAQAELAALINDAAYAAPRAKMLAFVRAQVLWNQYKMDPQFMLDLMKRHKAPLDWRIPQVHGLYWAELGFERCGGASKADLTTINNARFVEGCLKDLTYGGRLRYLDNPLDPEYPYVDMSSDLRYIYPAHEAYEAFAKAYLEAKARDPQLPGKLRFDENTYADGHRNFLALCIQMLIPANREKDAQDLFEYVKKAYGMKGGEWDCVTAREFAMYQLGKGGTPSVDMARGHISTALQSALFSLAKDDTKNYEEMVNWAKGVYDMYQKGTVARNKFGPLDYMAAEILFQMLVEPRGLGYRLSVTERSGLYRSLEQYWPMIRTMVYDKIVDHRSLWRQCGNEHIDLRLAFPVPKDIDAWRQHKMNAASPTRSGTPGTQ